jgi:hypothetical protein
MKNAALALAVAMLALAGTPVMAENPVEPSAPGSDKTPGMTPNDANTTAPKNLLALVTEHNSRNRANFASSELSQ